MALDFTDHSTLVQSIAGVLHRSDLASDIPGFVVLCESDMGARLKTGNDEVSTTLTLPTTGSVSLPAGFKKMRRLRLLFSGLYVDLTQRALAPSMYDGVSQGIPIVISIVGSTIQCRPLPSQSMTLALDYYGTFTPLSGSSSNWILAAYPGAYLYGSLLHSAPFLGQDVRIPVWNAAYENVMKTIKRADYENRMSQLQAVSDIYGMTNPGPYNIQTDQP